jgi:FMN phosphatase YigB (HAD superfamily)
MRTNLELSRFDAIVVSSEVGHEKPAPEIFKRALGTQ